MKKIVFLIILFFGFINISKADYLDVLSGSVYNIRQNISNSYDSTITFTGQYLFIKNVTCSNSNLFNPLGIGGNHGKINFYYDGVIKNHLYFNTIGTFNENFNIFIYNSLRITSSQVGSDWTSSIGCNINGILFDSIPNLLNSNTGTSMTGITVYTDSTTLNLFNNTDSLLEFYVFEAAIIFLIIIIALLFRLFTFR